MKLGFKEFERELDRILRFVPPGSECERLIEAARHASRVGRARPMIRRHGLLVSLKGAYRASNNVTVQDEISAPVKRIES